MSNHFCRYFTELRDLRRALRHESCELALERLGYAGAPPLRDRLGHGIGEDVLFASLQAVEDASRRGLGRDLGYVEPPVHIGVDGPQEDGMNRHALAGQKGPQRLRHVGRRRLGNGVAGYDRQGGERCQRQIVDDGSVGAPQQRQESARYFKHSEEVDSQVLLDGVRIDQIIVNSDAGIVNEDVEGADLIDGPLDLRKVRHVQRQWRHTFVRVLQCTARPRIYPLCTPSKRLIDEGPTDASVRAGDQDSLVFDVHNVLLSNHRPVYWLLRIARRGGYVAGERFWYWAVRPLGSTVVLTVLLLDHDLKLSILSFLFAHHPTTGLVHGHRVRLPGTDPANTLS